MADDGLMSYFAKMGLDTSDFLNGISKADGGVLQFYRDVSVSMAATMMVFDKVMQYGQKFVDLANQASDFVETIDKLSVTTGMSNEELQRFNNVARYAESDISTLAMSVNKMQINLSDMGAAGEEARGYLDDMGISYKNADGSLKSSAELFPAIIQGMKGLESSADRVTVANAVFGRGYQNLAGYMNMSREDMEEYFNTAQVMTEEQTQSLRDYDEAMKDLNKSTDDLAKTAGAELAPSLLEISQTFNDLAGNEDVKSFFSWLNGAITLVSRGIHIMASELKAYIQLSTGDIKGATQTQADLNKWVGQKTRDDAMKAAGYKTDGYGNVLAEEAKTAADTRLTDTSAEEERLKSLKTATDDLTKAKEDLFDAESKLADIDKNYAREMSAHNPRDVAGARNLIMRHQWDTEDQQSEIAKARGGVAAASVGAAKYGDVIVKVGEKEVARAVGVAAGAGERSLTQAGY